MRRFLLMAFVLLGFSAAARAQSNVSIALGSGYSGAGATFTLLNPNGYNGLIQPSPSYTILLNSSGAATLSTLGTGIQYGVIVCKTDGSACLKATVNVSGQSQDITATLQANPLGGGGGGLSGQTIGCLPLAATATTSTSSSHVCDNGTSVISSEPLIAPSLTAPTGSDLTLGTKGTQNIDLAVDPAGTGIITLPYNSSGFSQSICGGTGGTGACVKWRSDHMEIDNDTVISGYLALSDVYFARFSGGIACIETNAFNCDGTYRGSGFTNIVATPSRCARYDSGRNIVAAVGDCSGGTVYSNTQAGQTMAIMDTTMVTVGGSSQLYRFTGTINCTSTSASATATLNLKYTDTASTAQIISITDTCTSLVTNGIPQMVTALRAKNGTAITYGVTIANTPTYDVDVRLEQL